MNRGALFWSLLAVFQVLFGLAVFGATRYYYLHNAVPAPAASSAGRSVAPASAMPSDLTNSLPVFPGDAPLVGEPEDLYRRADDLFAQQRYDEAAQVYEQLIENGFDDVDTYNNLGLTLHYLGRSAEALSVLQDGIDKDGGYQRIWLTLGFVSGQIGHVQPAREALQKAVDLGPETDVGKAAAQMLEQLPSGTSD